MDRQYTISFFSIEKGKNLSMPPIAVQLYSVREQLAGDFEGTLRRIAAMGYAGVEFAGMYGDSPSSAFALCRELGLQIPAAHFNFNADDADAQIAQLASSGVSTLICAWLPPQRFETLESVRQVAQELNVMNEKARAHGLRFAYHNHDFEFTERAGVGIPHDVLRELTDTAVAFELDIYWIKVAGLDPAAVIGQVGNRAPLLHVKDGSGARDAMLPLGQGIIDIAGAVRAGSAAEWLVVELDATQGDMMNAIEESLRYLKALG
jgi:sugar phosphate isomerase/epimerase